jgi:hypothetical protein
LDVVRLCIATVAALLVAWPALAQHQHAPAHATPYAGFESRAIKALSEQQIADLTAGRGMGLALAAELNGYPGPLHVLEHADAISLTAEQLRDTRVLYDQMKAETIVLGLQVIEHEKALNDAFARQTITPQSLARLTGEIGRTQAELRAAHLRYHLAQKALLTAEQANRYSVVRGYGSGGQHPPK